MLSLSAQVDVLTAPATPATPQNCTNILVLGETGVGKSTLINSLANYLTFGSLDAALASRNPITLVHSRFSTVDLDTFEETVIEAKPRHLKDAGPDVYANEQFVDGQSTTQCCQSYIFNFQDDDGLPAKIRVIDTPGMGDTRGIAQDKKNMANIIKYATSIGVIHAIVLVFPVNESRLTVWLRFCILELLQCFDREAVERAIFLFTKARSTFFQAGETKTLLKRLFEQIKQQSGVDIPLRGDNTFLVDNEAYRFLLTEQARARTGEAEGASQEPSDDADVSQDAWEKSTAQEAWEKSSKAIRRLVKLACSNEPHDLRLVYKLQRLRIHIEKLAPQLRELHAEKFDLQKRIDEYERAASKEQSGDCQKNRSFLQYFLSYYPEGVMVCSHPDCSKRAKIDGCYYLVRMPSQPHPTAGFQWARNNGAYPECGHSSFFWEEVCFTLDCKSATTEILTLDIGGTKHVALPKKQEKTRLTKQMGELEEREKQVMEQMAACSYYIQKHSVVIRNETFLDGTDFEEITQQAYDDRGVVVTKMQMLQALKDQYAAVKLALESSQGKGDAVESLDDLLARIGPDDEGPASEPDVVVHDLEWEPSQ
ncbi:uncharacterized protein BJ171DRAFT_320030 [Polychytrium aggregatum]|uniref:uncharacterized protein n=1 Tax=Polychytrium aggregatum TaxID=110093 RepID=UPI0022FF0CCC|nr:uncharacterized protein BJ171DRAFT_320030 [Polychytrium aggregatum]KAI9193044.1 hypothetical protein BJ171DRAFT_320030 [Polychytrium aggregatum]